MDLLTFIAYLPVFHVVIPTALTHSQTLTTITKVDNYAVVMHSTVIMLLSCIAHCIVHCTYILHNYYHINLLPLFRILTF